MFLNSQTASSSIRAKLSSSIFRMNLEGFVFWAHFMACLTFRVRFLYVSVRGSLGEGKEDLTKPAEKYLNLQKNK